MTIAEISQMYKAEEEELRSFKLACSEACSPQLEKLSQLRNEISSMDSKGKLLEMLQSINTDRSAQSVITAVITSLQ